jgi:hypothetical protein
MGSGGGRARASPTKACRVCRLRTGERALLNGGLAAGWSARRLAERFTSLSRRDVKNHATKCVGEGKEE